MRTSAHACVLACGGVLLRSGVLARGGLLACGPLPADLVHRVCGLNTPDFESAVQTWVEMQVVVRDGSGLVLAPRSTRH